MYYHLLNSAVKERQREPTLVMVLFSIESYCDCPWTHSWYSFVRSRCMKMKAPATAYRHTTTMRPSWENVNLAARLQQSLRTARLSSNSCRTQSGA